MAGLFDTLSLGSRSLATYRKAIDTTGHNLANVNTPGYTRQRLVVESVSSNSDIGQLGAGAEATRVVRLQNEYFNSQVQVETSVEGSLQSRHDALQQALTALQETIDRNGTSGTSTAGISQAMADFFAGMQSLSTNPGSLPERQVVLQKAQMLATRFNQVDARLGELQKGLDKSVTDQVGKVNSLANDIARLNNAIVSEETASEGYANDLRDSRQLKLEELARLIRIDAVEQPNGAINVVTGGVSLVEGKDIPTTLETFDSGGTLQIRGSGQTTALAITGGAIEGTMATRDNDIASLRAQVNDLATNLISQVNALHSGGFGLNGSTGANFFAGTNAADIKVNSNLLSDPAAFQASGVAGEKGDNQVVLALAQLARATQAALNGQTFSDRQAQIVAGLGQQVADAKGDLTDQQAISGFVRTQREAVSGVSLDEEMANLVMFQKAFQASAKLISMTDELLSTIIQM